MYDIYFKEKINHFSNEKIEVFEFPRGCCRAIYIFFNRNVYIVIKKNDIYKLVG